jgi:hypothetical protein
MPSRQKIRCKKKFLTERPVELGTCLMNLTVKTRNGYRYTAVKQRFSSLPTYHSTLFTSSAPLFPRNPHFPAL